MSTVSVVNFYHYSSQMHLDNVHACENIHQYLPLSSVPCNLQKWTCYLYSFSKPTSRWVFFEVSEGLKGVQNLNNHGNYSCNGKKITKFEFWIEFGTDSENYNMNDKPFRIPTLDVSQSHNQTSLYQIDIPEGHANFTPKFAHENRG